MLDKIAKTALIGSVLAVYRKATRPDTSLLGAFGLVAFGVVAGAAGALLFAPKSGSELRGDIRRRAKELTAGAQEKIEKLRAGNNLPEQPHH